MKTKLPPFSGRCRAGDLKAHAARCGSTARYLHRWRALNPEQLRAGIERSTGRMLLAMAFVLGLAFATALALRSPSPSLNSFRAWRPFSHVQTHR